MTLDDFIDAVCRKGRAAAGLDYQDRPAWRDGAYAGIEVCRGQTPEGLVLLYQEADAEARSLAWSASGDRYWRARCKAAEIEWVLNCVSAALWRELLPHLPTARAFLHVAEITADDPVIWPPGIR